MDSEAVRERESCMGIPGWERQQGLALTKALERTEYNIPCLMSLSNVSNVFHLQIYRHCCTNYGTNKSLCIFLVSTLSSLAGQCGQLYWLRPHHATGNITSLL